MPAGFGACRERAPRLSRRGTRSTHTHTMRVTRARARARALLARAVGLLMNESNEYLFAQPGMHNISSAFIRVTASPKPLRGHIRHGNRTIVIVDQGCLAKTRAARGDSRSPCSARARSRGRIRASRTRERLIKLERRLAYPAGAPGA